MRCGNREFGTIPGNTSRHPPDEGFRDAMLRSFLDSHCPCHPADHPGPASGQVEAGFSLGPRDYGVLVEAGAASYQLNNSTIFGNVGIGTGVSPIQIASNGFIKATQATGHRPTGSRGCRRDHLQSGERRGRGVLQPIPGDDRPQHRQLAQYHPRRGGGDRLDHQRRRPDGQCVRRHAGRRRESCLQPHRRLIQQQ